MSSGDAVASSAAWAAVAAKHGNLLTPFLQREAKGTLAAGKARWQLVTLRRMSDLERAAVAWLLADAILRSRCGKAPIYPLGAAPS